MSSAPQGLREGSEGPLYAVQRCAHARHVD